MNINLLLLMNLENMTHVTKVENLCYCIRREIWRQIQPLFIKPLLIPFFKHSVQLSFLQLMFWTLKYLRTGLIRIPFCLQLDHQASLVVCELFIEPSVLDINTWLHTCQVSCFPRESHGFSNVISQTLQLKRILRK